MMLSMVFLIVPLVLMAFIIYVVICGQSSFHRNGCIGALNRFLTEGMWQKLGSCCQNSRVFGPCWLKFMACGDYVMNQRNPLVQIFYLGLIIPGWIYGLSSSYKYFPDIAAIPVGCWWAFHVVGVATLLSFIKASVSDPGVVTAENEARYNAAWDRDKALYTKEKPCKECNVLVRPARSKHCGLCHHCVSKLDHHCPWVNNCIGELNMRWFILFLVMSAIFCLYGSFLLAGVIYGYLDKSGLLSPELKYRSTRTGNLLPAGFALRVAVLLRDTGFLAPLGVFAFLMGIVLIAFTGFQLYHICCNTTTAETFKIADLVYISKMSAEMEKRKKEKEDKAKKGEDEEEEEEEEDFREYLRYKDLPVVPLPYKHAYDHGAWRNFLEMVFPPSLYKKNLKIADYRSAENSSVSSEPVSAKTHPNKNQNKKKQKKH